MVKMIVLQLPQYYQFYHNQNIVVM